MAKSSAVVATSRYVHSQADLHAFENPDRVVAVPSTARMEAQRLADIAGLAQEEYLRAIELAAERGASSTQLERMAESMRRAAEQFFSAYRPDALGVFTDAYGLGTIGTEYSLWEQGALDQPSGGFVVSFTAPDRAAIAAIANDNLGDLAGQTTNMIDGSVGILRTEAGRILTAAVADGLNARTAARQLEAELTSSGFEMSAAMARFQSAVNRKVNPYSGIRMQKRFRTPGDAAGFVAAGGNYSFVDRAGRQWDLRHYCEMAAHTKIMIAKNEGCRNRMRDLGVNHYMISTHSTDCPICGPVEGQVFWTGDGDDMGYDLGPDVPLHPNCEHTTVPWVLEAHQ